MAVHRALVALALLPLLPFATADQNVAVGPASVVTQNGSWGDGDCVASADGGASRYAEAHVALTPHDKLAVIVAQSCHTWTSGGWAEEGSSGTVQAGRFADGNPGPLVSVGWSDWRWSYESWGSRACTTYVYASGLLLALGCLPNGERWPMIPVLP